MSKNILEYISDSVKAKKEFPEYLRKLTKDENAEVYDVQSDACVAIVRTECFKTKIKDEFAMYLCEKGSKLNFIDSNNEIQELRKLYAYFVRQGLVNSTTKTVNVREALDKAVKDYIEDKNTSISL